MVCPRASHHRLLCSLNRILLSVTEHMCTPYPVAWPCRDWVQVFRGCWCAAWTTSIQWHHSPLVANRHKRSEGWVLDWCISRCSSEGGWCVRGREQVSDVFFMREIYILMRDHNIFHTFKDINTHTHTCLHGFILQPLISQTGHSILPPHSIRSFLFYLCSQRWVIISVRNYDRLA